MNILRYYATENETPPVGSDFLMGKEENSSANYTPQNEWRNGESNLEASLVGKNDSPLEPQQQVANSAVALFLSRFLNQGVGYYQQVVYPRFKYQAIHEPVTPELIRQHLAGEITIGLPAVNADGLSKWCCFDSDNESGDLSRIESVLQENAWHSIRCCRRQGKEGHLFLFFDKPVIAADLRLFGQEILAISGANPELEFFPKQDKPTTLGNPIRLPLGIHRKEGANNQRGWFEGVEQDVNAQLAWFAQQPLNNPAAIKEIANQVRQREKLKLRPLRVSISDQKCTGVQTPILDLIPAFKRSLVGGQWITQCPVCADEGHDKSGDNLRISGDGKKFCCWYGGQPGKIHTAGEIIRRLVKGGG